MPFLFWIFGPNGVGKTTNAQYLTGGVEHFNLDKIIMDLVEIDQPGLIKELRNQSADINNQDNFLIHFNNNAKRGEADLYNSCKKKILIQESFSMESNFLPHRNHPILREAIQNGYLLSIIFIGEQKLDIIKERVLMRTKLTGQFVSEKDIQERYRVGLEDANSLLDVPCKLEYFSKIADIRMFTMPNNYEGLNLIINIQQDKVIHTTPHLLKSWSELVGNLTKWTIN